MQKISRVNMTFISICFAIVLITILSFLLPIISLKASEIILDRYSTILLYPFTIQNFMIILFVIGLGELFLRWKETHSEYLYVINQYLPEDERTLLQSHDLGPIRQKVLKDIKKSGAFLPNMINRCILQFQVNQSVSETNNLLTSMSEIYSHQIDLKYHILRYISWAIPTVGFIGTVVGIAYALGDIKPSDPDLLLSVTTKLSVAFNTTLLALILSSILVFCIHWIQEKEETCLNKAMEYCLNNFINRLYTSIK
ncbi:MotA/TolQ/ExbB proton channel [Candidatus Magnetomorum sp. HK-1]|nr:MotA/TolQ/ExbB proton channel [Candidatus Magnetomorum sp. HK-1]